MNNMPEVKLGIVAVSRDCFPESLICKQKKGTDRCLHKEIRSREHLRMSNLYRRERDPYGAGTRRH